MELIKFGLIGAGTIAARHMVAIQHVGGELCWISDIKHKPNPRIYHPHEGLTNYGLFITDVVHPDMLRDVDFVVICSPSHFHRDHTKMALDQGCRVICEKPICLPWEPIIDDNRVNVCLQLRWIENLPQKADLVRAVMVRDKAFFDSWKGNPRLAGGNLYEFFIHYIDLAILMGAGFEGEVLPEGKQIREICGHYDKAGAPPNGANWTIDIMSIDMQSLYNKMYVSILTGDGIRPKDIMYLMWVLNQNSAKFGYRYSGIQNKISFGPELL